MSFVFEISAKNYVELYVFQNKNFPKNWPLGDYRQFLWRMEVEGEYKWFYGKKCFFLNKHDSIQFFALISNMKLSLHLGWLWSQIVPKNDDFSIYFTMISSEDIYGSISLNTNPFGKKDIYTYIGRVKLQNHYTKIIYFRGGRFEVKSCRVLWRCLLLFEYCVY